MYDVLTNPEIISNFCVKYEFLMIFCIWCILSKLGSICMARKTGIQTGSQGDESYNLRREFLDGEREKNKTAEDYRKKKISLLEKIVQQQSELIEIQRRTTTALEVIATKFHESTQSSSPYSLSPVIKFS